MNKQEECARYGIKAQAQLHEKKFDEALLNCRKILRFQPRNFLFEMNKIEALKSLNKYKQARIEIRRLLQMYSGNSNQGQLLKELGKVFLNQGKFKKAKKYFKLANKKDNWLSGNYHNDGVHYTEQNEFDKALVCFNSTPFQSSIKYLSLIGEGYVYFHQGKFELAKKYFEKSKVKKPYGNYLASANLCLLLAYEQKYEEAKQKLSKELKKCDNANFTSIIDYSYKTAVKQTEIEINNSKSEEEKISLNIKLEGLKFIMNLLIEMHENSKKLANQTNSKTIQFL